MQKITEQQIKILAKEIVQLSKNNSPIKHSNILEVISKILGYRDYNALSNNFKNVVSQVSNNIDINLENKVSKSDNTLKEIRRIKEKLELHDNTLSNKETQSFKAELKAHRLNYGKEVQSEDTEKWKIQSEKMQVKREKEQYDNALQKFNLKYYSVLEVLSRALGYNDYYSLRNSLKKEVPLVSENMDDDIESQLYKANQILRVINTIKQKLDSEKSTLSNNEIQKLEKELKILSPLHTKVLNKYKMLKKELKTCPNCNGQGEFILGLPASATKSMHYNYEYGDYSAVAEFVESKGCFWCSYTGKTSNNRIQQMEKMKRESPKKKIFH